METILYNLFNGILEVCLICFFFHTFAKPTQRKERIWCIAALCGIFTGILFVSKPPLLNFIIILTLIVLISMFYQMKWYNHIFLSILAIALFSMAEMVVAVISSIILHLDMVVLKTGPYVFSGMMISKLVIFIVITIIRCGRRTLPVKKAGILWIYIATVILTSIVTSFIVLDYMYTIVNQPIKQALTITAVSLLILINVLLFYVIDKITSNIALEYKFSMAQQFIENQKTVYENLYTRQQEVRKIRHDLQNELAGILHQLENQKTEETITHIKDKLNLLEANKKNSFSGHNAVDTLLKSKQKPAESKGIAIETNLQINNPLPIDTIDLFILLGNGLDNAIEATHNVTKHNKVITVLAKSQGESLLIVIKNPVDDIVDVTQLISSKPDFNNHGFGIIQMKQLTEKYNGDVFFECTKEQFKATILINNRRISTDTQRIGKHY